MRKMGQLDKLLPRHNQRDKSIFCAPFPCICYCESRKSKPYSCLQYFVSLQFYLLRSFHLWQPRYSVNLDDQGSAQRYLWYETLEKNVQLMKKGVVRLREGLDRPHARRVAVNSSNNKAWISGYSRAGPALEFCLSQDCLIQSPQSRTLKNKSDHNPRYLWCARFHLEHQKSEVAERQRPRKK